MNIQPSGKALGAQITAINLATSLDEATATRIRDAL